MFSIKKSKITTRCGGVPLPGIPATQEAEAGGSQVRGQSREKDGEPQSQKQNTKKSLRKLLEFFASFCLASIKPWIQQELHVCL